MPEYEIQAFEADTKASKGLTAAHIAEAANLYDQSKAPAPLVFGHPTNDSPALGVIAKARSEGAKLFVTLANVAQEVIDGVKARRILNRSIAFWDPHHPSNPNPGKYSIRHIGLLGGQAPAIAGMPALKFSADDSALEMDGDEGIADAVIFAVEAAPTGTQIIREPAPQKEFVAVPKTVEELEAELKAANEATAAAEKAREDQAKTFAAAETTRREAANAASVKALVGTGQVLPAEEADMAALFNALPVQAMTFSTGEKEPVSILADFLGKLPKRAPINDNRLSPVTEFNSDDAKAAAEKALEAANEAQRNAHKGGAAAA